MVALYAYRIYLILVVYLVFLGCCIQNLLVWIRHVAVDVHELVDHVLRDDGSSRQILHDDVFQTSDRSAAYTHVYLGDVLLENILQLLDDADEALPRLVDVIDNTLSDARR